MEEAHELTEETYQTEEGSAVKLDESQLVTLRLGSRRFIRFQPDTRAQCNVLPLHMYRQATDDKKLEKVKPIQTSLIAYGDQDLKL